MPLAAAAATVLTAIIAGFFAFMQTRGKNRIDFQAAINGGFTQLLAEHRKDIEQDREIIRELRATIDDLETRIDVMETERRRFVGREIALEAQIRRAGLLPVAESDIIDI